MSKIDKYETYRTIACLIIGISTLISAAFVCKFIENCSIEIIILSVICFISGFLINLAYKICDKKIEKYNKDNAKELSFESSQL